MRGSVASGGRGVGVKRARKRREGTRGSAAGSGSHRRLAPRSSSDRPLSLPEPPRSTVLFQESYILLHKRSDMLSESCALLRESYVLLRESYVLLPRPPTAPSHPRVEAAHSRGTLRTASTIAR